MTGKATDAAERHPALYGWLVFSLALLVRIVYLLQYSRSPFFLAPQWDAADYHSIASALSHGHLDPALPFRPPLYPVGLSLLYMLFGAEPFLPRFFQIMMGAGSCVLVMKIGMRLFGRWAGLAAGVAAAFAGLMFYFDMELLPTSLELFLLLLLVWELLLMSDGSGSPWRAGLWFGLGVLARPVALALLPPLVWYIWRVRSLKKSAPQFLLGLAGLLAASLFLHLAAGYGPVAVSAQGGVNFYIGNHHQADGITAYFPGLGAGWGWDQVRGWAEQRSGGALTPARIDKLYYAAAAEEIANHPLPTLRLALRKARLFWNNLEIGNNQDYYYAGSRFPWLGAFLWLGFPLALGPALVGVSLWWRKPEVKLLAWLILFYFLGVIPYFVTGRFRHPLTPLLFVLAAGGIKGMVELARHPRNADIKRWGAALIALTVGLILPWSARSGVDAGRWDYGYFTEGAAWDDLGNVDKAEEYYQKALRANSRAPYVNSRLAELAVGRGDRDGAIDYYRRELTIQPTYAKVWNNLGVQLQNSGQEDEALSCFQTAAQLQPHLQEALHNAARIWSSRGFAAARSGDWLQARDFFTRAESLVPADPLFKMATLEARRRLGDTLNVNDELAGLISDHPDLPKLSQLIGKSDASDSESPEPAGAK